jgi:photosynthetic reaction center H subunit
MSQVFIVGGLDVAELVFYLFFLFFLGLVIYLRREDRREGYPLEEDDSGLLLAGESAVQRASPKVFNLPNGTSVSPELDRRREPVAIPGTVRAPWNGSPLEPTGNPLTAGVGPGAWVSTREDVPEMDRHGQPRILPIGMATGFRILDGEPNPVGWTVRGSDGATAGIVSDVWVDTGDHLVRYLAVEVPGEVGTNPVLMPITMCSVRRGEGVVDCDSLPADAFAGCPRPAKATQVTKLEEDRITGYFGAGYLYGSPDGAEPWL